MNPQEHFRNGHGTPIQKLPDNRWKVQFTEPGPGKVIFSETEVSHEDWKQHFQTLEELQQEYRDWKKENPAERWAIVHTIARTTFTEAFVGESFEEALQQQLEKWFPKWHHKARAEKGNDMEFLIHRPEGGTTKIKMVLLPPHEKFLILTPFFTAQFYQMAHPDVYATWNIPKD